ncbi:hypothetical protein JHK86_001560 [Glycine max]|nr:hypothetical protein JHK86_001560 [Glycine max]
MIERDFSEMINTILEPKEVEAYAFCWAIIIATNLLLPNVIFESDCLQLVQSWNSGSGDGRSLFHALIAECKRLLPRSDQRKLLFMKRNGNRTTHCLASFDTWTIVWTDGLPVLIVTKGHVTPLNLLLGKKINILLIDRKLHGIFEASSKGKMYIDPYAWIDDNSDLDRTQYPAQVKVRVRLQCKPLSEDQFSRVIAENYYKNNHFWFELDHRQANKLTSLLASFAFASGCHLRQKTISQSLSSTLKEGEAFETHESETKSLTSLSKTTIATEITSLDGDIKSLDVVRVETEEMNIIYEKLKEWAHESQDLPISDHLDDTEDETEMFTLEKHENDENEMDIEELMELTLVHENPDISVSDHTNDTPHENDICTIRNDYGEVPTGSEEKEKSSSPLIDHQNTIIFDELMQEVEELKTFKKIQTQTNCYLDDMLREAELKIQHLIDRCTMLELAFNLPPPHAEKTSITSYAEQRVDPTETSFLKGNFNEEAWLSTIDLYCPAERVITLYPVNSAHSCASMVQLNVGSYSPIFDKRTLCPSLNQSKGNLAVLSLNDQMFAVDCANGIDSFSDIEVFDLDNGRWISAHSHSMIDKAFAIAAAEFNNWFHTTFGNGINYLKCLRSILHQLRLLSFFFVAFVS